MGLGDLWRERLPRLGVVVGKINRHHPARALLLGQVEVRAMGHKGIHAVVLAGHGDHLARTEQHDGQRRVAAEDLIGPLPERSSGTLATCEEVGGRARRSGHAVSLRACPKGSPDVPLRNQFR